MGSASAAQPDPSVLIQYGLLVKAAEDVQPNQTVYKPGDIINIAYGAINVNYQVVTTFYGNDLATELNLGNVDIVSFGFVAQDAAGNAVVSVRGTDNIYEWVQDAKFLAVKCPFLAGAGLTEDGFTDVYESLRITPDAASARLVDFLPNAFPKPVTSLSICGHSLGGALATLLALDVAANTNLGATMQAYTYASPRTGDPQFADSYNQEVPRTIRVANRLDIVPKLPVPPLYDHVLGIYELNPKLKVKLDLACQHHLTTYLYLLSLQTGGAVLPLTQGCSF